MSESQPSVLIVGAGVVGAATGVALQSVGYPVTLVDIDSQRRVEVAQLGLRIEPEVGTIRSNTVVMICVPTPANSDGFDRAVLERAVRSVGAALCDNPEGIVIAIRSTVPPGTCELATQWLGEASNRSVGDGYEVVCMPEFLRQASAMEDAQHPRVTVVASPSATALKVITELVQPLGGEVHTSSLFADAEMIKCAHNAFNATKISFWNEMHAISGKFGADPSFVARVVTESAEGSWNPMYGTQGGLPYVGACLPKDIIGFAAAAEAAGIEPVLLRAVTERNALTHAETAH